MMRRPFERIARGAAAALAIALCAASPRPAEAASRRVDAAPGRLAAAVAAAAPGDTLLLAPGVHAGGA
ncbi:MAG TPA: hypothetical protein VFU59_04655, partial [Candidatus Eisenbacteria bacterium]|nr:hypothetical protein [Candidatus Eisenbacteria bacterium]